MFKETFITLGKIFKASVEGNGVLSKDLLPYKNDVENLKNIIKDYHNYNGWFEEKFVKMQLISLANMLNEKDLTAFEVKYGQGTLSEKKVKIIAAGNIPLVCFHDIFCILFSGKKCVIKFSQKDKLLPYLVTEILKHINPELTDRIIEEKDTKENFDAIIATGSNNSSRYFEYYFAKYPHIIRHNRNSVAVITGEETAEDYKLLAEDIFAYYGLGCRSVSKIYVPKDYDYQEFFKNIVDFSFIINNSKYADNYDYNKAIYLMAENKILINNFLILKEDENLSSPVGVLFAERYENLEELSKKLTFLTENLQCVVSKTQIPNVETVKLGSAQTPSVFDFADGVDTMEFLKNSVSNP